jgi:hypothetical protein
MGIFVPNQVVEPHPAYQTLEVRGRQAGVPPDHVGTLLQPRASVELVLAIGFGTQDLAKVFLVEFETR